MNLLRLAASALLTFALLGFSAVASSNPIECEDDKQCPAGSFLIELPPKEECTIKECVPVGFAVGALIECTGSNGMVDCVAWPKGAVLSYSWSVSGQLARTGGGSLPFVSLACRGSAAKGYYGTATLGLTVTAPGGVKSKDWLTVDCSMASADGPFLF